MVFFFLSFSDLSHHHMCGSESYAQYYAKGFRFCIIQKTYVLCYVKVYVLCYVEGYVMINVVQRVHRLTP